MNFLKSIIISLFRFFLKAPNYKKPQINEIKKILIVRQHNQLGDMLLSIPLFRAIKENFTDCVITLVVSKENYDAIKQNDLINKIILFEKSKFYNPYFLFCWIKNFRRITYDLVLVPITVSLSKTSCFLARLAKSQYYIGPGSLNKNVFEFNFIFNEAIDFDWDIFKHLHVSEIILKILEPFKISVKNLKSIILLNEDNREFSQMFFAGITGLKIGIHIGAGKISNRWDIKNFMELVKITDKLYHPFFYFTIGYWEKEMLNQISSDLKCSYKILMNQSIQNIAAVVNDSDLFISNDTGIMHVAGTTNTPVICLFGPTEPEQWAPTGDNIYWLKNENDINSIKPDDVLKTIQKILNE